MLQDFHTVEFKRNYDGICEQEIVVSPSGETFPCKNAKPHLRIPS